MSLFRIFNLILLVCNFQVSLASDGYGSDGSCDSDNSFAAENYQWPQNTHFYHMKKAIHYDDPKALGEAVRRGANIHEQEPENCVSYMSDAVESGSNKTVEKLISLKYDVNKSDVTVGKLIAEGYGLDEETATDWYYSDDIGRTPLMRSVIYYDYGEDNAEEALSKRSLLGRKRKITEMLIESNADVRAQDYYGATALDCALRGRIQPGVIALLVGSGAHVAVNNEAAVESSLNSVGLQRLRDMDFLGINTGNSRVGVRGK